MFKPILALGIVAAAASASATTVVVSHVYNPANILPISLTGEPLATPFTLAAGDTLDITITFTGGATVFASGEDGLWLLSLTSSGPSAVLQTTGTLEFLGASSNLVAGPIALAQTNAFFQVGSLYSSGLYRLDSNPISFTGLRQVITIDSDDIGVPREYYNVALTYLSGTVGPGVIPEPGT